MSRSYKKLPIFGYTGSSDKKDKQFANRRFRKHIKLDIKNNADTYTLLNEVSCVWAFAKDGKCYWSANHNDTHTNELINKAKRK